MTTIKDEKFIIKGKELIVNVIRSEGQTEVFNGKGETLLKLLELLDETPKQTY